MKRLYNSLLFTFFVIISFVLCMKCVFAETYPFDGIIDADALVIYSTNSSKSEFKSTELAYGTRVKVLETATNNGGRCSMYKISYEDDKIGYTCASYVRNLNAETRTTDKEGIEAYQEYIEIRR